jgi:site-specific recombinase XerD
MARRWWSIAGNTREDVMAFVRFVGIRWPEQATALLTVSITDVQDFREALLAADAAPKTLNRRISSLSGFYKYLHGAAAELRLPITVPNPAHAQFIARECPDARDETRALSSARARQLMNLPTGESVLDYRDRAILKLYIYSGIRLTTGCRLKVTARPHQHATGALRSGSAGDRFPRDGDSTARATSPAACHSGTYVIRSTPGIHRAILKALVDLRHAPDDHLH